MSRVPRYPIFAADGRRLRSHSAESIERLEALKLVVVQRNRRGIIVSAHYYGQTRMPLQSRLRPGTKYSFREAVANGNVWTLKPLPFRAMDAQLEYLQPREVVDAHVKALFCAVPLSITTPANESTGAKVIPFADAKRKLEQKKRQTVTPQTMAA